MSKNTFRDNKKGMSLEEMMKHTPSYKDGVASNLIDIITNEKQISEKDFKRYDEVMKEVEDFYQQNKEQLDELINDAESNKMRKQYCAEKIYNEYFKKKQMPMLEKYLRSKIKKLLLKEHYEADVALENLFHEMYGDYFLEHRDEILDNVYSTLGAKTINLAYEVLSDEYPELLKHKDEFYKAAEKEGYFVMTDKKWKENELDGELDYPLETKGKWYGDEDYEKRGGKIIYMTPDEFLSKTKPLLMDKESKENIKDLIQHIKNGGKLDPLVIYSQDKTDVRNSDGRHRALAAKQLGINKLPVIVFPEKNISEEQNREDVYSDTNNKIWFTGRGTDSTDFNLDYVGREEAVDKDGPGFYFTNDLNDAERYAEGESGVVLECKINYNKLCPTKGKPNEKLIKYLIVNAPDYKDTLSNFGENLNQALIVAINSYSDNDNPADAYQTIWHDFYRYNPKEYLQNIGKFYDGHIADWTQGKTKHLIVYKPEIIEVIKKIPKYTI